MILSIKLRETEILSGPDKRKFSFIDVFSATVNLRHLKMKTKVRALTRGSGLAQPGPGQVVGHRETAPVCASSSPAPLPQWSHAPLSPLPHSELTCRYKAQSFISEVWPHCENSSRRLPHHLVNICMVSLFRQGCSSKILSFSTRPLV